jgi:hypothetical protein
LKETLEEVAEYSLGECVEVVGVFGMTNADEVILADRASFLRRHAESFAIKQLLVGDEIRDWASVEGSYSIFPYDGRGQLLDLVDVAGLHHWLWPCRATLGNRATFSKGTYLSERLPWWKWHQVTLDRLRIPLSITFAFVASHNHFVLDRGGRVFKQSAPIIKLPADATEDDHLALLGLLNSSTACFWMKQNFQTKGSSGMGRGIYDERCDFFYEHTVAGVGAYPVLDSRAETLPLARELDALAREIIQPSPAELVKREVPSSPVLQANHRETEWLQSRMIALQEELDWLCYRLYGLMESSPGLPGYDQPYSNPPEVQLGQRPFEIALARAVAAGEAETSWFERHGSTPVTEIPKHWPVEYQTLVARRAADFRDNPNIALIERPEYKRRWLREPWDDQVKRALRSWLLDRLESGRYWPDPAHSAPELVSCAALANIAARDAEFQQVAALYAGRPDFDLTRLVEDLVASESVPFLPVLRYKPSGLVKRQVWERTWDLQRREDAGEKVGSIPVPPKYEANDFQTDAIKRLRGKLDVPKERFVSYPHCSRDGDPSLVVGWAGWDHLRQATALAAYYERMKTREGWPAERLVPLLAELDQLVPWLIQWHNEVDPEYDLRMGDYYRDFVRDESHGLGFTLERVRAWQPPAKAKGGRGRKKT